MRLSRFNTADLVLVCILDAYPYRVYLSREHDTPYGLSAGMVEDQMQDRHQTHEPEAIPPQQHLVKDPVCGMTVDPHQAKHRAVHAGRTYYFCSGRCRERFAAEPAKYLAPELAKANAAPEGTIYTCPMHPEIRQAGPGSCPICGMALEPVVATAEAGPNPELADMTRRFWIGAALSIPVVALEMGGGSCPTGCSSCSQRLSSCGAAGPSSCAAGGRS